MDRLFLAIFVLAACALVYLYGAASAHFGLFPYRQLQDAFVAADALIEAWREESAPVPPTALNYEAKAFPPTVAEGQDADQLVLIPGGPYQLMEHCPELGCLAWIQDRRGEIKHVWPIDPAEPWGESERLGGITTIEDIYAQGLHLFPNGDLLVSYQIHNTFPFSLGIAKFDKDGNVLWRRENLAHHWFQVADDGRIYLPAHDFRQSPLAMPAALNKISCKAKQIYEDLVLVLGPDGREERRISVLQALMDSGYGALIMMTYSECDPLHLNDVRVLGPEDAAAFPGFAAGDLLISMNTINTLAVLDGQTARVKWLFAGQTYKQHAPRWFEDGEILALDNLGGMADQGGTRIVAVDLSSRALRDVYPAPETPDDVNFHTTVAGHIDLTEDDARMLVALTTQGRVLEIDIASGEILWEYHHVFDVRQSGYGEGPEEAYARFNVNAAYYVPEAPFLN